MFRTSRLFLPLCILAAALLGGVAPVSATTSNSPSPPQRTINLGAGPIKVGGAPIKVAYFGACSCNTYNTSMIAAISKLGKTLGIQITQFDANLDPLTQVNQMTNALREGYNAWAVGSVTPEACAVVKKAIKQGIVVSVYNEPICTNPNGQGTALWLPGTVNYVGGDETTSQFLAWVEQIQKDNPGPQDVLLVAGTPGFHQTLSVQAAAKQVQAAHPNFKITVLTVSAYDLQGAQAAVSARLLADKNITILGADYSDMTQGAVLAMKQENRTGIKVYDMGGSTWAVNAVKTGQVQSTSVFLPATEVVDSVESVYNAWNGHPGPKYVDILKSLADPFITKANVGSFTPQY